MAYIKNIFRTITNNLYRFISLIAITFVGITFIAGIGGVSDKVRDSLSVEMNKYNSADVILKNITSDFSTLGFNDTVKEKIQNYEDIEDYAFFTTFETTHREDISLSIKQSIFTVNLDSFDITFSVKRQNSEELEEDVISRYYAYPFDKEINKLKLVEGNYPVNDNECVVEQSSLTINGYDIGDTINLKYEFNGSINKSPVAINNDTDKNGTTRSYKIVGIVQNPLFFAKNGEEKLPDDINSTESTGIDLKCIMYAKSDDNPFPVRMKSTAKTPNVIYNQELDFVGLFFNGQIPQTDCFITFKDCHKLHPFSNSYRKKIDNHISKMKEIEDLSADKVSYIDYSKNKSYMIAYEITDKVDIIIYIFPALFLAVILLVTGNNLTKMISDDRSSIGTLKSLGYNNRQVITKYLVFAFISMFIGALAGLLVGMFTIPNLFVPAFKTMLFIGGVSSTPAYLMGLISAIVILLVTQLLVVFIAYKNLKSSPASLMIPKAPKAGKKIFLERSPKLWSKLKFKTKSCFRNIFRYKLRLIMTIFSTALSTGLVMAGFGLYDVSKNGISISGGFTLTSNNAILYVSIVILLFAMLLSILVLYNIINMNIDERRREIATLKVLGYKNKEVYSYIFKDVVIMAGAGIIIGLPIGIIFLVFIFKFLSFGGIGNVAWYSYIFTIILSFSFIFIVFLMMLRKMNKINMADSLQSRE